MSGRLPCKFLSSDFKLLEKYLIITQQFYCFAVNFSKGRCKLCSV